MNNYQLHDPVHFIGIGGIGMSGLAQVLLKQGFKVQGSDIRENSLTQRLKSKGAKIIPFHSEANLKDAAEVIYSSAIPPDNCELLMARKRNLPLLSRGELLSSLLNDKEGIVVCGTHGKTTTTSLISFLLWHSSFSPTFVIGGEVDALGGNAHVGSSSLFVAEADESDGSFLQLNPSIGVVSNIEDDHLDYYKSTERLQNAFLEFMQKIKPGGWLFAGGDCKSVSSLLKEHQKNIEANIITYGLAPYHHLQAVNIQSLNGKSSPGFSRENCGSRFEVVFRNKFLGRMEISLPGVHNVINSLPALGIGLLQGIKWKKISQILPQFRGARRRFEFKGRYKGTPVIDDYAHHPSELRATLNAVSQFLAERIVVVFQPHRFTRTKNLASQFAEVLEDVDMTVLLPIYSAGEEPIPGVSSKLIYDQIRKRGNSPLYMKEKKEVVKYLQENIRPGDIVLTIGAGDVWKVGEILVEH